jgi:hypothetical protein
MKNNKRKKKLSPARKMTRLTLFTKGEAEKDFGNCRVDGKRSKTVATQGQTDRVTLAAS